VGEIKGLCLKEFQSYRSEVTLPKVNSH